MDYLETYNYWINHPNLSEKEKDVFGKLYQLSKENDVEYLAYYHRDGNVDYRTDNIHGAVSVDSSLIDNGTKLFHAHTSESPISHNYILQLYIKLQSAEIPRRLDGQRLLRHRMDKRDAPRVKRDAAVGVGTRRTIFQITLDGTANVGQLTAHLVVAARVKIDLQQMVATVGDSQQAIVELCQFGLLSVTLLVTRVNDKALVQPLVAHHIV